MLGKAPGEFRRSQVWVGGTRPGNAVFVPPPASALAECLDRFERFLHDQPEPTPPLLKAALAHVQFETIHPFLDGNGRIGRLLIVLQLVADGLLHEPLLYPSLFFKQHRALYYELLSAVRTTGDWERWLDFFAEGVTASATQALHTAQALLALVAADRDRIAALGRLAPSALEVHKALQRQPVSTSNALVVATGLVPATVNKALAQLQQHGVVNELTAAGHAAVGVRTDVSKLADIESLAAATMDTYGAVHVLCNNAGVGTAAPIGQTSLAD